MSWTIEKLKEVEDRIAVVKCELEEELYLFRGIDADKIQLTCVLKNSWNFTNLGDFLFYDHDMKLIESPKEREFEILEWWYYPLSKNIRLNSSSYEGFKEICSNKEANAVKVKGADKFKRYLDTGEIEVME